MKRTLKRGLLMATAAVMGAGALVFPAAGAAQALTGNTHAWLQVKLGSSATGHIDITVYDNSNTLQVSQCVYDDVANSSGPYDKVTLRFNDGPVALASLRNTTGTGTYVCRTNTVTRPGGSSNSLQFWTVEKGNCSGSTCTRSDIDEVYPSRPYCIDTSCEYNVWQAGTAFRYNTGAFPDICDRSPSTANCNSIWEYLSTSDKFRLGCQQKGQTVGGNPYWIAITSGSGVYRKDGWIPSYYLDYPADWVDQVPYCDN